MLFYWLKTVTSSSRFCINITHLNESETLITVMSELFFCEGFSVDHVIITTIISSNVSNHTFWMSGPVLGMKRQFNKAALDIKPGSRGLEHM